MKDHQLVPEGTRFVRVQKQRKFADCFGGSSFPADRPAHLSHLSPARWQRLSSRVNAAAKKLLAPGRAWCFLVFLLVPGLLMVAIGSQTISELCIAGAVLCGLSFLASMIFGLWATIRNRGVDRELHSLCEAASMMALKEGGYTLEYVHRNTDCLCKLPFGQPPERAIILRRIAQATLDPEAAGVGGQLAASVQVPEGARPGEVLCVQAPTPRAAGTLPFVHVHVPEDARPGERFTATLVPSRRPSLAQLPDSELKEDLTKLFDKPEVVEAPADEFAALATTQVSPTVP